MKLFRISIIILSFVLVLLLSGCDIPRYVPPFASSLGEETEQPNVSQSSQLPSGEQLKVHFIDVGQGDSAFIEFPDGECMLIDAGEWDYSGAVISLIDCLGYTKIDHLVATHPHSDHIGGMQTVVECFEIGEVYMPEAITDTSSFIGLLEALDKKNLSVTAVSAGEKIDFNCGAVGRFVAPVSIVEDLNNCSAVLHLGYKGKSFLFTGDAEIPEEATITADIDCDVLKVGHHGSYTSSGKTFLDMASPSIAVISCGKDNEYGHPHKDALDRLNSSGVESIYRTDLLGTVTISTDGNAISVSNGYEPSGYKWILNIRSKKVHTLECDSGIEMKPSNKAYSVRSLEELINNGFALCGSCDPEE